MARTKQTARKPARPRGLAKASGVAKATKKPPIVIKSSPEPDVVIMASIEPTNVVRAAMQPASVVRATMQPASVVQATMRPSIVVQASMPPVSVNQASIPPASVVQSSVPPVSVNQATMQPADVAQATMRPASVVQTTVQPANVAQAIMRPVGVVQTTIQPASVAQATTRPASVVQASAPPAGAVQSSLPPASVVQANMQPAGTIPDQRVDSYLAGKSRIRVIDLLEAKKRKEKWAMLTSYDTISARIFDQAKIPCILVGDSASQMVYGYKSTLPVTMDELIPLARAVSSGCTRALVIADLPFGSYQESPEAALKAANRFMKESQVHGIKLEGGKAYENHVKLLVQSGIPVMGHIGFTPQSEHALSGFKIQGRDPNRVRELTEDALALERAGAFACVLELMPTDAGKSITQCLQIPTIGIGAGADCDAQVLVWHDMAGFNVPSSSSSHTSYLQGAGEGPSSLTQPTGTSVRPSRVPKFVKQYANMGAILFDAAKSYARDVSLGRYPGKEHSYDK